MLYALGQHQALRSVQSDLDARECLFAFHDDICTVSQPEGVADIHTLLRDELWQHSRIRIHRGKTKMWNRGGSSHLVMLHCSKLHAWRTWRRSSGSAIWQIERKREAPAFSGFG